MKTIVEQDGKTLYQIFIPSYIIWCDITDEKDMLCYVWGQDLQKGDIIRYVYNIFKRSIYPCGWNYADIRQYVEEQVISYAPVYAEDLGYKKKRNKIKREEITRSNNVQ